MGFDVIEILVGNLFLDRFAVIITDGLPNYGHRDKTVAAYETFKNTCAGIDVITVLVGDRLTTPKALFGPKAAQDRLNHEYFVSELLLRVVRFCSYDGCIHFIRSFSIESACHDWRLCAETRCDR